MGGVKALRTLSDGPVADPRRTSGSAANPYAQPALERLLSDLEAADALLARYIVPAGESPLPAVVLSVLDNTLATVRAATKEVRETLGILPKPDYG